MEVEDSFPPKNIEETWRQIVFVNKKLHFHAKIPQTMHTADAFTEPDIDNYGTFVLVSISHKGVE